MTNGQTNHIPPKIKEKYHLTPKIKEKYHCTFTFPGFTLPFLDGSMA